MSQEVDSLKNYYQAYVAGKTPKDRRTCPSPRALRKTFTSSAPLRRKKKLIDHFSECAYCKDEFFFLMKLSGYEEAALTEMRHTLKPAFSSSNPIDSISSLSFLMKYATILFGFAFIFSSFILIKNKEDFSHIQRRRDPIIKLISPLRTHQLHSPLIFLWREHPDAQYYILELFNDALLPLWTSPRIMKLGFHLPEEIFSCLNKNRYYFWMITAFSNSEKIAESDLASFLTLDR